MYILNIHIHTQKIALNLSKKKSKQQVAHQVAADPAGRTPGTLSGHSHWHIALPCQRQTVLQHGVNTPLAYHSSDFGKTIKQAQPESCIWDALASIALSVPCYKVRYVGIYPQPTNFKINSSEQEISKNTVTCNLRLVHITPSWVSGETDCTAKLEGV